MSDFDCTRRKVLRAAALYGITPLLRGDEKEWTDRDQYQQRIETFFHQTDTRPEYAWVNREDVFYHDTRFPAVLANAPEARILIESVWVFNRAMQWIREEGAILCYENAGALPLTGETQVSAWHTGAENTLSNKGEYTHWGKRSHWRRDCAVLPAFQFHAAQHPILDIEIAEADTEWQFCASLKGRSGPPLISTAWQPGPGSARIEIARELLRHGFDWSFPEIHFAIGTWHKDRLRPANLLFRVRMIPQAAAVGCLPVIRTVQRAKAEGVPVIAAVVDNNGRFASVEAAHLSASILGQNVSLQHRNGLWVGRVLGLEPGDYTVNLVSSGSVSASATVPVRVTDGRFFRLEKAKKFISRGDKLVGPMSGSYQGTFYFRNAGTASESMVQTQQAWNDWPRSGSESVHMHFWESLRREELDERFRLLGDCGWDLLTLHQHWGDWERLDAGGRIAPHGAEQLARYLQTAARYDLAHIQALSSGPYASPEKKNGYGMTFPYSRYLEKGFHTDQFMQPGTGASFDDLFHSYLEDFATLFSDETALFAMTGSGEGDNAVGPARTNDTESAIRRIDKNHMVFAETVLGLQKLPIKYAAGFHQQLFGGRTYGIGNSGPAEFELGVYFKFLQMAGMYLAEGSWPPMPDYVRFHYDVLKDENGSPRSWTGTPEYCRRWRDTLYLALIHQMPVTNSWDEMFTESEHLIFRQVRDQIDWRQNFVEAPVLLKVDDSCANMSDRSAWLRMAQYEEAFSRLGLMYRFVDASAETSAAAGFSMDARQRFEQPRFRSEGGTIPDELKAEIPVVVHGPYARSHLWSQDRKTLLAYIYNVTNHKTDYMWLCGTYHRVPNRAPLRLELQNLPGTQLAARVFDLNSKALALSIPTQNGRAEIDLGSSDHDFLLLVTPG